MTGDQSPRHPIDELAEEFVARYRRGERPSVSEYRQKYPALADQLGEVLQALVLMEQLAPDQGPAGGPAAGDGPAPERLGEYRILREVGRGGMGVVYAAEQESLGRRVALKVLPAHARLAPTHLERFRREAKAAARLHHTNIVPVFGVGEQDGLHYYAMQLIDGQGLDQVVREVKRLRAMTADTGDPAAAASSTVSLPGPTQIRAGSEPSAPYYQGVARVGLQAAEALAYAHGQGVLHRDIKPSNLLLDTQGTVWVADFGLARAEGLPDLTESGDLVGTLRYLAPERLGGRGDARSDVYSLGLTLYELLALRPAFQEADRGRLIRQITLEDPPPPGRLDRRVPRDLETVVLRAIAKEPDRRYPSAQLLADDLRRFLADRPVQARRVTWREQLGRWCRRNPALALVSGLAVTSLLTGLALVSWQWWRAEGLRERAEENERLAERQGRRARAHLDRAVQAIDRMLTQVGSWQWQHLPQFAEQRRAVLEQALQLYQEMLDEDSDDPQVRLENGQAHRRLGDILKLLGRHPEAERAYARAVAQLTDLAADEPSVPEYRQALARSHNNLAVLYRDTGRRAETRAAFRAALELWERLARDAPEDHDCQLGLASTIHNLGVLHHDLGESTEAAAAFRRGLDVLERLAGDRPGVPDYPREVAGNLQSLADVYLETGRQADAEAAYRRGRDLLQGLTRDHPTVVNYQRELAAAHQKLGTLYLRAGRPAEAEAAYQEALAVQERLARDHADVPERQRELATSHNNLGLLYRQLGRGADAAAAYRRSLAVYEALARTYPHIPEYRAGLAAGHANLGALALDRGRPAEAEAAFRENLAVAERLAREHPEVPDYRRKLANTFHNMGMAREAAGRRPEALADFQRALDLRERLARDHPAVRDYRSDLAKSQSALGSWYRDGRQWAEAEAAYLLALDLREALTHDEPDVPGHTIDLGGTYCNLGHVLSDRGDSQAALDWYDRAIRTFARVLERLPAEATARRYLTNAHQGRAMALGRLGRHAEALPDWDRAVELAGGATRVRHRIQRGFTLARAGLHERAAAEARELAEGPDVPPGTLYPAASVCSLGAAAAGRDERLPADERARRAEAHAGLAVELLRRAVARGLTGARYLRQDPDLEPLRPRSDFQQLMTELEARERAGAK